MLAFRSKKDVSASSTLRLHLAQNTELISLDPHPPDS